MGFRVEGVTEASLTSDVSVACLFQHSRRGLAGLSPSAFSEGVCKLWEPLSRPQGSCKSPSAIRSYSPDPEFFLPRKLGGGGGRGVKVGEGEVAQQRWFARGSRGGSKCPELDSLANITMRLKLRSIISQAVYDSGRCLAILMLTAPLLYLPAAPCKLAAPRLLG